MKYFDRYNFISLSAEYPNLRFLKKYENASFHSFDQIEFFFLSENLPQVQLHRCYYLLQEIHLLVANSFVTDLQFILHPQ